MLTSPTFSYDWFTPQVQPVFERWLVPLAGVPLDVLEIGSFEGRSTVWLLEHVLTHPGSVIDCVDTFAGGSDHKELDFSRVYERFLANIAPFGSKVRVHVGPSADIVPSLLHNTYDIAFIDGSHEMWDVLQDAIAAFNCVQLGGLLVFDDYGWGTERLSRPAPAIDAFLHCFGPKVAVLEKGYCVVVRKL